MASQTVAQLLASLGVVKSHSRPHVSNDNPFSESQFKTMKYRPEFPNRFGSYEDARGHCRSFFKWYNDEHYHTGIGLLTPAMLHYGAAEKTIQNRARVLRCAYEAHPERFVRGCPKPQSLPTAVWINPPATTSELSGDNNVPHVEIQTPSSPIGMATGSGESTRQVEKTFTRSDVSRAITADRISFEHEKRLPEIVCPGKPDAALTHPRPGYPLASCVPTELASVSPSELEPSHSNVHPQPPLNTRAMPKKIPGVRGLAPDELPNNQTTMIALH